MQSKAERSAYWHRYYIDHLEQRRANGRKQAKEWARKHPKKKKLNAKRSHLRVKYGLTLEDSKKIVKKQKRRCRICRKKMQRPNFDHCHKTKKVRGALCRTCNLGLGMFHDDARLLRKAAKYLEKS